jgi:hypothetical protein
MADPKKPEAKSGGGNDNFNKAIFALIGVYFIWIIIQRINFLLVDRGTGSYGDIWETIGHAFFVNVWPVIKVGALLISLIAGFGIYKILQKFKTLRIEENALYGVKESGEEKDEVDPAPLNPKWEQIQMHMNSKNPSEWRVAIIEADIMLDDLLKTLSYHGDTVGDKLKAVEKSDFTTVEAAWEAHKVRNQIAHQGADFQINDREVKRVIGLFETVFREFQII